MDLIIIPSLEQLRPKIQVGKDKYLHEAMQEGQCIDCHNPHSSDYDYLIKAAKVADLCQKCHEIYENAINPHEPVAEGECTLCHYTHSSNNRYLLTNTQRQLCFDCHEDTKAELNRFEYIHKPAADMDCRYCHETHGSDYFRLLNEEYSPEFYAPFDISNYALCFSCHQEDFVLTKETDNLTNFRNGNTNLHYLHVNMPKRGRTCRTCHATHASNEPKHLREKVPYGGWKIPIQFEKTESGGNCSPGCHDLRGYDRIQPVIYITDKSL